MSEWISVEDRLPEKSGMFKGNVLVFDAQYGSIEIGWLFDDRSGFDSQCDLYNVTHWMPLPEPPK